MNGQLTITETWSERARRYVTDLSPGDEFTADALRRAVGDPDDANQLGAVVVWASKRHLIRYRGRDLRSDRALARGRYNRVWVRTAKEAP